MRERTKAYLTSANGQIADAMGVGDGVDEITYSEMASSALADTVLAQAGETTAVLKLFSDDEAARAAFDRERNALHLFGGEIAADLLGQDEANGLVIMAALDGKALTGADLLDDPVPVCEKIGALLGQLRSLAPVTADAGTWGDYLERTQGDLNREVLDSAPDGLLDLAFEGSSVAHNDPALSNIIALSDGTLRFVDFENSQFKPDGWDLLLATRVLAGQAPQQWEDVVHALVRGYRSSAGQRAVSDQFMALMGAVFVAMIA